jgi:hypothetical protein
MLGIEIELQSSEEKFDYKGKKITDWDPCHLSGVCCRKDPCSVLGKCRICSENAGDVVHCTSSGRCRVAPLLCYMFRTHMGIIM